MNQDIYDKLLEYNKRSFIQACKISFPLMYKNNIEYIKDYLYEVEQLINRIQYIFFIIFRCLFILTSPISFPLGIFIARLILKCELKQYEAKSLSSKEIKK